MIPEVDKRHLINFVCSELPEDSFHGEAICINDKVKDIYGKIIPNVFEFKHLDRGEICYTYFLEEEIIEEIE